MENINTPLKKLKELHSFLVDINEDSSYSGWKVLARERINNLSEDPDIYDVLHKNNETGLYDFPDFLSKCDPEEVMILIKEVRKKFKEFSDSRY